MILADTTTFPNLSERILSIESEWRADPTKFLRVVMRDYEADDGYLSISIVSGDRYISCQSPRGRLEFSGTALDQMMARTMEAELNRAIASMVGVYLELSDHQRFVVENLLMDIAIHDATRAGILNDASTAVG